MTIYTCSNVYLSLATVYYYSFRKVLNKATWMCYWVTVVIVACKRSHLNVRLSVYYIIAYIPTWFLSIIISMSLTISWVSQATGITRSVSKQPCNFCSVARCQILHSKLQWWDERCKQTRGDEWGYVWRHSAYYVIQPDCYMSWSQISSQWILHYPVTSIS